MTRNGNSAVCSRCKKVVKLGKNGTTSNALRHLRSAHQLNVELEAALTRQKLVKRLLCRFVIMELLPIKAVISPSMKRLLSTLDPKLTTPSYYSITKTLNIISTQVENTVSSLCKKIECFALTTDGWKANSGKKFIIITLHAYVERKLMYLALQLPQIDVQNVANMKLAIEEAIKKFGLNSNCAVALVTDGAANMLALCRGLNIVRSPCVAHYVQLFLKKILSPTKDTPPIKLDEVRDFLADDEDDEDSEDDEETDFGEAPLNEAVADKYLKQLKITRRPGVDRLNSLNADSAKQKYDTFFILRHSPPTSLLPPETFVSYPFLLLRKVMVAFKRNSRLRMALKEKQNDGLSVLIGCETRWGTTFDMTSRFLKLWVSFAKLAAKTSPAISSALRGYLVELVGNVPLFSCFVDFWKPFHELQTKLQAERYPTAGHVIPSLLNAASNSQNWIPPCISAAAVAGVTIQDQALTALLPEYAEIINTISVSITVKLKEGFATAARACRYWNDMVLVKIKPEILDVNYFPMELRYATILTPIFKKLPFLNEDDRAQWYAAIGDLIEKNTIRRSSLTGFLISALPPYPDPESELCQYLSLQPTADDADEEQFWFDTHSVKFEVLPKLFKRFCCIPATSAPSERFFSLTGLVCTKRRANLKSETIEKIALCNKNIKSILGAGLPDPLEV